MMKLLPTSTHVGLFVPKKYLIRVRQAGTVLSFMFGCVGIFSMLRGSTTIITTSEPVLQDTNRVIVTPIVRASPVVITKEEVKKIIEAEIEKNEKERIGKEIKKWNLKEVGKTTVMVPDKVKVNPSEAANDYIKRYWPLAKAEERIFGIPACITMAQGLVESGAGSSRLAKFANNHFGVKCFSHKCREGHCMNFNDDTHKDFFIKYKSVWESYRAHSNFLKGSRYSRLFKLGPKDWKGWAYGLKKCGYATDPDYALTLIATIQAYGLDKR
jgi:flagellum-specific peptidoglycan hydrolase FlgJ